MQIGLIILILVCCLAAFVMLAKVFDIPIFGANLSARASVKKNIRAIVSSQRGQVATRRRPRVEEEIEENVPGGVGGASQGATNVMPGMMTKKSQSVDVLFSEGQPQKTQKRSNGKLTLQKKLKFAQWQNFPPFMFIACEIVLSIVAFMLVSLKLNLLMQLMALGTGPVFMGWLLNGRVDRRFSRFDADYPAFLLSLVGLLKTGMSPLQGLEAAAEGLEETSLVRQEVELMIERLRFGVPEDRSIGSFGEDVFHPEIELFVQALLLSRRVGGNLSDTLDRMARQVRKRQYFRNSARAAIGQQRGSIWFILAILAGLEVYMYFIYPEAVVGAWADPVGAQVWQFAIFVIFLGVYWIRQVTKIKT